MRRFQLVLLGLLVSTIAASFVRANPPAAAIGFSRDVLPLLTKEGCNSSKCHGAVHGPGGLRLSPLSSNALDDFAALAKDFGGRRVSTLEPHRSLLLTRLTSPQSSLRLSPDSDTYRILHAWIEQGAAGPAPDEPRLVKLETSPKERALSQGDSVKIQVRATWSDDVVRDVTRWTKFQADEGGVVKVERSGVVTAIKPGLAAVSVRFLDLSSAVKFLSPYPNEVTEFKWLSSNAVDRHFADDWRSVRLQPADDADDRTFCRRVSLQLTGRPPSWRTMRDFLNSDAPDKRGRLVDQLLASAAYAEHWSDIWTEWLLEEHWVKYSHTDWRATLRESKRPQDPERMRRWLQAELADNRPAVRLVERLLTASGSTSKRGANVFYAVRPTPALMARGVGGLLGVNVSCARCHDHPQANWSAEDYANLIACFKQVRVTERRDEAFVTLDGAPSAQRITPSPKAANFSRQSGLRSAAQSDNPRRRLADWIVSGQRRALAGNIVNRYWKQLFASGLVDPPDGLTAGNPGAHPELLDELVTQFLRQEGDLKQLLRTLCSSRLYQLSSKPKQDKWDEVFYSHFRMRLMRGRQLRRTIESVADVQIDAEDEAKSRPPPFEEDPVKCSRDLYRRSYTPSALFLGPSYMEGVLKDRRGFPFRLTKSKKSLAEVTESIFHNTVQRAPTDEERKLVTAHFKKVGREKGVQEIFWALINSREFAYIQ